MYIQCHMHASKILITCYVNTDPNLSTYQSRTSNSYVFELHLKHSEQNSQDTHTIQKGAGLFRSQANLRVYAPTKCAPCSHTLPWQYNNSIVVHVVVVAFLAISLSIYCGQRFDKGEYNRTQPHSSRGGLIDERKDTWAKCQTISLTSQ